MATSVGRAVVVIVVVRVDVSDLSEGALDDAGGSGPVVVLSAADMMRVVGAVMPSGDPVLMTGVVVSVVVSVVISVDPEVPPPQTQHDTMPEVPCSALVYSCKSPQSAVFQPAPGSPSELQSARRNDDRG